MIVEFSGTLYCEELLARQPVKQHNFTAAGNLDRWQPGTHSCA